MDFSDNPEILDLCTGACPIGISLAKSFESAQVSCTDISESALRISRINISRHNISNISLFKGNLDSEINPEKKFHLITANPPYIPSSEIEGLMPEVKRFEPVTALDGGPGGYDFYTPLSCIAEKRLFKNGRIYMETGWNQAQKVAEIFKKRGFETGIIKDYSNIERHVFAEKK
jgi:release factor glutamine methyltransferase